MRTVKSSPNIMAIAARSAAALAFVLGLASAAMAQIPGALSQKSPDAAESVARVQQNGRVRIIVMFQAPASVSEVRPESESIAAAKAQVAAIKDAIIAAHFGSATAPRPGPDFARGLTRFEITPGFAVTVTRAELEALAAYPNGEHQLRPCRAAEPDRQRAPDRHAQATPAGLECLHAALDHRLALGLGRHRAPGGDRLVQPGFEGLLYWFHVFLHAFRSDRQRSGRPARQSTCDWPDDCRQLGSFAFRASSHTGRIGQTEARGSCSGAARLSKSLPLSPPPPSGAST
jgi:hypothetical protein